MQWAKYHSTLLFCATELVIMSGYIMYGEFVGYVLSLIS